MNYIAQKNFSFAGDAYSPGMVFDPAKYPAVCTIRKLKQLISGRFIIEDFKVPDWQMPKSKSSDTSSKASESLSKASNTDKPKRTKA